MKSAIQFPKVYASATKSQHGSAAIFTTESSYNPFDATAPGMTPELALKRAEYAANAINYHADLLAACKLALSEFGARPADCYPASQNQFDTLTAAIAKAGGAA